VTRVLWRGRDHRFTKARASEYLDGDLDARSRARVERHASVCPQCRALLASLRRVVAELPRLSATARGSVADGVLERLRRGG
jgi:anti-sigma factor RsiW